MHENGQSNSTAVEQLRSSLVDRLAQSIHDQVYRTSQAQHSFLSSRRSGLSQVARMIAAQIPGAAPTALAPTPVMDSDMLDIFGTGRLSDCLGSAYSLYDHRRAPRIPNGDLKLVSRVMAMQGEPGSFSRPAHIHTEYDMPRDAWYLRESPSGNIPYSVWMEMALQPCGILSAWMGTMLQLPEMDLYFRNLDGWAELLSVPDLRGSTITARADLLATLAAGDTIIQKFRFELSQGGTPLYRGESSFGYFSGDAMDKQLGLDGGQLTYPEGAYALRDAREYGVSNPGRLDLLGEIGVQPEGGRHGLGSVYARRLVNPADWFYACHFHQDPVMPGSLGVEAILSAVQAYAAQTGAASGMRSPRFSLPLDSRMTWKYRGQITPAHHLMELEAHIRGVERRAGEVIVSADASLWVDHIRIYDVKQAAISLLEGTP